MKRLTRIMIIGLLVFFIPSAFAGQAGDPTASPDYFGPGDFSDEGGEGIYADDDRAFTDMLISPDNIGKSKGGGTGFGDDPSTIQVMDTPSKASAGQK
ncbi:MAG: hypothetical protein JMN24_10415 [gamma proteobacterium endosymbiont of Lamellibrachia anaximandri]|nr:hypothetical protein [gamma proteobacterium endosymbiont of Lamellibrachia anaximandri]MBL3617058.1 hypothetical protein [gamma proteobacterium endosymbiont of Lamellibrachia anaximandri]